MRTPRRLCFIADARSPISRQWIEYFRDRDYDVHVVSLFPAPPDALPRVRLHVLPLVFSGLARGSRTAVDGGRQGGTSSWKSGVLRQLSGPSMRLWWGGIAPLDTLRIRAAGNRLLRDIQPDVLHALRIPPEGELAGLVAARPLVVSVWGNDFTLWADRNPLHRALTRRVLRRADALLADCARDLRLARHYGFDASRPSAVYPGNGGVRRGDFRPADAGRRAAIKARFRIDPGRPVVVNPRGIRGYIRNDTFFNAIPAVRERVPDAVFVGVDMAGDPRVARLAERAASGDSIRLLGGLAREEMADLFAMAEVVVSPSEHDGTPNTLLEAMASGAFPVVGDIESVREWIAPETNGLLFDTGDARACAHAIIRALEDDRLRAVACERNVEMIRERADYETVMPRVEDFYARVFEGAPVA